MQNAAIESGFAGTCIWILGSKEGTKETPDYDGFTVRATDSDIQQTLINHAEFMLQKNR